MASSQDEVEMERRRKIEAKMFKNQRRHYKKDTRYVLDLYTLTFDEDETVDSIGTIICKPETSFNLLANNRDTSAISSHYFEHAPLTKSKSQPSFDFYSMSSFSSNSTGVVPTVERSATPTEPLKDYGPVSLPAAESNLPSRKTSGLSQAASLASLETNLHKILARKFADEMSRNSDSSSSTAEEVSFQKAKLLTKAYYRLLRSNQDDAKAPSGSTGPTSLIQPGEKVAEKPVSEKTAAADERLRWQALINADAEDLKRMVDGLGNTAQALNEYLVDILVERDGLLAKQDDMLEEISELADTLLQK